MSEKKSQDFTVEVVTNISLMFVSILLLSIDAYPLESLHISVSKLMGMFLFLVVILVFCMQGHEISKGFNINPMDFSGLALGLFLSVVLINVWYFTKVFNFLFDWLQILIILISLVAIHFTILPSVRILSNLYNKKESRFVLQFIIQCLAFLVAFLGLMISLL